MLPPQDQSEKKAAEHCGSEEKRARLGNADRPRTRRLTAILLRRRSSNAVMFKSGRRSPDAGANLSI